MNHSLSLMLIIGSVRVSGTSSFKLDHVDSIDIDLLKVYKF